jgi:hypothetical protein
LAGTDNTNALFIEGEEEITFKYNSLAMIKEEITQ